MWRLALRAKDRTSVSLSWGERTSDAALVGAEGVVVMDDVGFEGVNFSVGEFGSELKRASFAGQAHFREDIFGELAIEKPRRLVEVLQSVIEHCSTDHVPLLWAGGPHDSRTTRSGGISTTRLEKVVG